MFPNTSFYALKMS